MSRPYAQRALAALGSLAVISAGLGAVAAPSTALPAPAPPIWPQNGSIVPANVSAIQLVLSGGRGGGGLFACQITTTQRVSAGDSVSWILGADGAVGTASSGGVEPGGAGGIGAYGYSGGAGGDSSTYGGAQSGGGGGGASAFEINGLTRVIAGGTGGSAGGWPSGWCDTDGRSDGTPNGDMIGGSVTLASSITDVIAGGLGGTVGGQPGPPGTAGNPSTGVGAGVGGSGGVDGASTPWSYGGGGGGGGGFAGGGGGVGASAGSSPAPGGGGGNLVLPGAAGHAPVNFQGGASSSVTLNWVHVSDASLPAAQVGVNYDNALTATFGGVGATTPLIGSQGAWQVAPSSQPLPAGLQLDPVFGTITGRPTVAGAYDFTVIATQRDRDNLVVAQSHATFSITVRPATAPTAPRHVVATPGSESATVTFDRPVSNGGAAIESYVVTADPGSRRCVVSAGEPRACTVSGLRNGAAYTFTVVARNSVGDSAPSAPSPVVRPHASRQRQTVQGVSLPTSLSRATGNVLLRQTTLTNAGEPVRLRLLVAPLVRMRPAGNLELYRLVTGANGSKTLYITTTARLSVTVKLYANATAGYRKWSLSRTYIV